MACFLASKLGVEINYWVICAQGRWWTGLRTQMPISLSGDYKTRKWFYVCKGVVSET